MFGPKFLLLMFLLLYLKYIFFLVLYINFVTFLVYFKILVIRNKGLVFVISGYISAQGSVEGQFYS